MREGRIRPSLRSEAIALPVDYQAAMREGRIRPSLASNSAAISAASMPQ